VSSTQKQVFFAGRCTTTLGIFHANLGSGEERPMSSIGILTSEIKSITMGEISGSTIEAEKLYQGTSGSMLRPFSGDWYQKTASG